MVSTACPALPRTCQGLLPHQPLRGTVELLDELARQQACCLDLHPLSDAKLHQAQLEDQ